nr:glycosyltransferase [Calidifontimicrobium sp. SYSU G02091]
MLIGRSVGHGERYAGHSIIGGAMRVAVVTPYFKEPSEWLERCIRSVRQQSHPCDHLVVADGHPQDWLDGAGVRHLRLDRSHSDYGNTPRSIGAQLAVAEGYDAIAFLDADNWYEPDHIQSCVEVAERTGADFVCARRFLARADGSRMPVRIADDDAGRHVDTNCFFILFGAFHTLPRWLMMPKPMTMWGDRFFLASLRQERLREAFVDHATVNYLCTFSDVFELIGETPPPYAKAGLPIERLNAWVRRLQPGDLAHVKRLAGCDLGKSFTAQRMA